MGGQLSKATGLCPVAMSRGVIGEAGLVHMGCCHELVLLSLNSSNRFYSDTNLEENYTIYNTHEICGIALDVTNITS